MFIAPQPPKRLRATDADEKLVRREQILEAASRLYGRAQALPSVAEVAAEAGLAKGTMYLYFETKEAIYLALHERHTRDFFAALNARLDAGERFDFNDMRALVETHMIGNPSYLPLSNACMSAPADHVPMHTHEAFETKLATWMTRAGAGLERHHPALQAGDGMRLLHHGYALVLGLYQLLGAAPDAAEAPMRCTLPGVGSFRAEAMAALRSYWNLAVTQGLAPIEPAPIKQRTSSRRKPSP